MEITRITWAGLDKEAGRVLVRDMKHPGDKKGNHVFCDLVPEALAIIESIPRYSVASGKADVKQGFLTASLLTSDQPSAFFGERWSRFICRRLTASNAFTTERSLHRKHAPAYSGRRSNSRSSSVMAAIFSSGISAGRFGGS